MWIPLEITGMKSPTGDWTMGRSVRPDWKNWGKYTCTKCARKCPSSRCWDETGKNPITVRWLDINKGAEENREYRSRLVAQEIKRDKREDLFAATPLLEAKKLLFSMAVTEGYGYMGEDKENGVKIDFVDVSRAFFHAPT